MSLFRVATPLRRVISTSPATYLPPGKTSYSYFHRERYFSGVSSSSRRFAFTFGRNHLQQQPCINRNPQLTTTSSIRSVSSSFAILSSSSSSSPSPSPSATTASGTEQEPQQKKRGLIHKLLRPFYRSRVGLLCYDQIAAHVEHPWFAEVGGRDESYARWFSLSSLHVWLCYVRLRQDGDEGQRICQELFERFWADAEQKMMKAGIRNPLIMGKHQKQYLKMYFGTLMAYDKGLVMGDAELANSLWRNFFGREMEHFSPEALAKLVHYVRMSIKHLDQQRGVIDGRFEFASPESIEVLGSAAKLKTDEKSYKFV